MGIIADGDIHDLLRLAEERIQSPNSQGKQKKSVQEGSCSTKAAEAMGNETGFRKVQPASIASKIEKKTAGDNWFNLPKSRMTPTFKREWQLLRMRALLDPKHQKKALRQSAPEYSHMGELIAGPTDFYSSRLTKKERKGTISDEVMGSLDGEKLQSKYTEIQRNKASGKRGHYQDFVSRRRKRQNNVRRPRH